MKNIFDDILGMTDSDKNFIIGPNPSTYSDVFKLSDQISKQLKIYGCDRGDRIGIAFDQGLHYVASLLAINKINCVSVPMSLDWTSQEIDRVSSHSQIKCLITSENLVDIKKPYKKKYIDQIESFLFMRKVNQKVLSEEKDAIIIYTSRTTSQQKGVVLTEESISNNVISVSNYLKLDNDDSSPIFTSTCYAYSISMVLTHAFKGASLLPFPDRLMFPNEILEAISNYKLTGISSTPTAFNILLHTKYFGNLNFDSVRYIMSGGQPFTLGLYNELLNKFSKAKFVNMYGCTENSPRISYYYIDGKNGLSNESYFTVGKPIPGTEIKIIDEFHQ